MVHGTFKRASVTRGPGAPHHDGAGEGGDAQQHMGADLHFLHHPQHPRHEQARQLRCTAITSPCAFKRWPLRLRFNAPCASMYLDGWLPGRKQRHTNSRGGWRHRGTWCKALYSHCPHGASPTPMVRPSHQGGAEACTMGPFYSMSFLKASGGPHRLVRCVLTI